MRSDGTPTYFAADAAYVRRKYAKGFDHLVYVLGADHHGYVGRLQALAEMLGHPRESLEVLIYQLVHLTRGGEATKMSKRRGDVVFLDDFIDEIGIDAARWYLVSRGHDQTIDIDIDLAAEKSAKNPVFYVQYAHARIAGILRNAPAQTAVMTNGLTMAGELAAEERELVKRILEFPGVVAEATERRAPHAIPTYAIRLADDFHRFYHHHKVLGSPQESLPARPLHRDEDRDRPLPRPDRGRGAGQHVTPARADALEPRSRRARDGLGADRSPRSRGRRSTRRRSRSGGSALAAVTLAVVALVGGRLRLLRPGPHLPTLIALGVVQAAHWWLFFEAVKRGSVALAVLTFYCAPIFLAVLAPLFLPEKLSNVALGALVPGGIGIALVALAGEDGHAFGWVALACGIGSALTFAVLVILSKRLLHAGVEPLTVAFWDCLVGSDRRSRPRSSSPPTSCPTTPASGWPCSCSASSSPGSRRSSTRCSCAT